MSDVSTKAADIKLVIFDVDGVLTNGGLFFGDSGEEYKMFNSKDGHGMKMLQDSGVHIAIITGRSSNVVTQRMITNTTEFRTCQWRKAEGQKEDRGDREKRDWITS